MKGVIILKMMLTIECPCGHIDTIDIKRFYNDNTLTITDSVNTNSSMFEAIQYYPDTTYVTCKRCREEKELLI